MSRATRETVAGRTYLDLQAQARQDARPFDELLSQRSQRRLPPNSASTLGGLEAELPNDDDNIVDSDVAGDASTAADGRYEGWSPRPPQPEPRSRSAQQRRDVDLHMTEVFSDLPLGAILTVREIASHASSQYQSNEVSQGAIAYRISAVCPPGLREAIGMSPLSVEKFADTEMQ